MTNFFSQSKIKWLGLIVARTTSSIFDDISPLEIFLWKWFLPENGHWKTYWHCSMAIVAEFFFVTIFESCNNKGFELKAKVLSWQIGAQGLFFCKHHLSFDCVLAPYFHSLLPTNVHFVMFSNVSVVWKSKVFCTTSLNCNSNNICSHWKGSFVFKIHWRWLKFNEKLWYLMKKHWG